ncbi:cell division protein ZapA [Colwelliaceae bacterium 6471]
MSKQTVEIKVIDRKLKIGCPLGQETALAAAANELNIRLEKTSKSDAISTPEQALLLTALNLANDLLQCQKQMNDERIQTQSKIELLQSTIEQALMPASNKTA